MLHRYLQTTSVTVPAAARTTLWAHFRANAQRNEQMQQMLVTILATLRAAGITAVPFKGVALATTIYDDVGLRAVGDLDVALPQTAVPAAINALRHCDYHPDYHLSATQQALLLRHGCEYHLSHAKRPFPLELHWRILPPHHAVSLNLPRLLRRCHTLSINDSQIPIFSPEDTLLILCLHGYKHRWSALKWIGDVAHLLHRQPDLNWEYVQAYAHRRRVSRLLLLGLALAHNLLAAPLPVSVQHRIAADDHLTWLQQFVHRHLYTAFDATMVQFHLPYVLRAYDRARDALTTIPRRLLSLNRQDLTTWVLPPPLAPLYYLPRLLRLVRARWRRLRLPNKTAVW